MSVLDRRLFRNNLSDIDPNFGIMSLGDGIFPEPRPIPYEEEMAIKQALENDGLTEAERQRKELIEMGILQEPINVLTGQRGSSAIETEPPAIENVEEQVAALVDPDTDTLEFKLEPEPTPAPTPAPDSKTDSGGKPDSEKKPTSPPEPTPEPTPAPETAQNRMAGFLSSTKFLDFLAAVGTGISLENSEAKGMDKGATIFTQGEKQKEALKAKQEFELKKEMLKQMNKPMDPTLIKIGMDSNTKLLEDKSSIEAALGSLQLFDTLRKILETEDATSIKAIYDAKIKKPFQTLFGRDVKDFAKLGAREKAELLANQIKTLNAREILGESGRTISNLDRQLVEELVANFSLKNNDGTPNIKTSAELVAAVDLASDRARKKINDLKRNMVSLNENVNRAGAGAYVNDPNLISFLAGKGGLEILYPDLDLNFEGLLAEQEVIQFPG